MSDSCKNFVCNTCGNIINDINRPFGEDSKCIACLRNKQLARELSKDSIFNEDSIYEIILEIQNMVYDVRTTMNKIINNACSKNITLYNSYLELEN